MKKIKKHILKSEQKKLYYNIFLRKKKVLRHKKGSPVKGLPFADPCKTPHVIIVDFFLKICCNIFFDLSIGKMDFFVRFLLRLCFEI